MILTGSTTRGASKPASVSQTIRTLCRLETVNMNLEGIEMRYPRNHQEQEIASKGPDRTGSVQKGSYGLVGYKQWQQQRGFCRIRSKMKEYNFDPENLSLITKTPRSGFRSKPLAPNGRVDEVTGDSLLGETTSSNPRPITSTDQSYSYLGFSN